jgi:acyl-CoA synthetase (AMP-forming)/AMP-acid ligase II
MLPNPVCFCLQHDAVLECAVLGLPDEAYGEVICAIIVPKEDAKKTAEQDSKPVLTLEALTSWSKDKLAPYKVCYLHYFAFSQAAFYWVFHKCFSFACLAFAQYSLLPYKIFNLVT